MITPQLALGSSSGSQEQIASTGLVKSFYNPSNNVFSDVWTVYRMFQRHTLSIKITWPLEKCSFGLHFRV
jgi:hypothetical protein